MNDTSHDHPAEGAPHGLQAQREHLRHAVHHYAHMLSEQGPMNITFVHNNTLLGLQHLHFEQAAAEAGRVLGGRGYEPLARYRAHHAAGRIGARSIDRALDARKSLPLEERLAAIGAKPVPARQVLRAHLVHGIDALPCSALRYAVEHEDALTRLMADVPAAARASLLERARRDLTADLARIGRDWTLADWLQHLLGLDVPGHVRAAAAAALHGPGGAPPAEVSLAALGISPALQPGYLACIDSRYAASMGAEAAARERLRAHALNEERIVADAIARRHFDVAGSVVPLRTLFVGNAELYAATALWKAALRSFGLVDPLSPVDARTLAPQHTQIDGPEQQAAGLQSDGVSTPLEPVHEHLIRRLFEPRAGAADADPLDAQQASELERVLRDEWRDGRLGARGLQALEALVARGGSAADRALLDELRVADPRVRSIDHVDRAIAADVERLAHGWTHSDWLTALTGVDGVEQVNAYMIRVCAAFVDEGLAAWHMPERALGFYEAWRRLAASDAGFDLDGLPGWRDELAGLPSVADDAVVLLLGRLGVEPAHWGEYLGRMLACLKGWAGMAYWYETHPKHYKQAAQPIDTIQYLAVRLFYESLLVRRTCRVQWNLDGDTNGLRRYFEAHRAEYLVRRELHARRLPDALAQRCRELLAAPRAGEGGRDRYAALAEAVWAHRSGEATLELAADKAWRLYRLAQLCGWSAGVVEAFSATERDALIGALDAFPEAEQAPVWLAAYEGHYRDEILNAMALNRGRGRWAKGRGRRPKSQVVFCIDEREENIHRHYEELDPEHETLGAAGFFGVAQAFIGLDDHEHTPLCPAVATPAHRILEIPRLEALHAEFPLHKRRVKWMDVFDSTYWESKRNLVASYFLIDLAGLFMALPLVGRVLAPHRWGQLAANVHERLVPPVRTRLTHVRMDDAQAQRFGLHTLGHPIGFTNVEAADRVEASLRNWGLTTQLARIVVICAHRSISVNNPHENAHDCGACGGKAGGPNARLFAALANHPPVRELLRERGIAIPADTWFVGAEHNTASSRILYFDTEDIPASLAAEWRLVHRDLEEARMRSARERCRRFASAPKDVSIEASTKHVEERTLDLSQVRPEWGHCTNAFAVVGRRMITQGIFFDRRGFVISYDPTHDADGKILERILMAVGPVGAGISLEYYFSTVDPDVYGCGTKVPHNVTGMIGVMAGAHGDLQTGLPRQMTEVHEAMRLQLVVDAKMEVLGGIYGRQAAIRQLLDNQWVHLIAHDPDSGEFNLFVPGTGFVKWDEPLVPIPEVRESFDWFRGKYECFLPPARITEPTRSWKAGDTGATRGTPAAVPEPKPEFSPSFN